MVGRAGVLWKKSAQERERGMEDGWGNLRSAMRGLRGLVYDFYIVNNNAITSANKRCRYYYYYYCYGVTQKSDNPIYDRIVKILYVIIRSLNLAQICGGLYGHTRTRKVSQE